jgi:polyhydroxybutyrate depolymerase
MKTRSVSVFLLVGAFMLFPTFALAFGQGALQRQTLMHGEIERAFFIHYPKNRQPTVPRPVVLVLHGADGADAETMSSRTGMNEIADREDFIVVYPAGVDGQWNDGRGMTFRRAKDNTKVDDVGFISALIDLLVKRGDADSARIYAMGLSNGGMMTHRLGIELGKRIAAIAPVIANMPEKISTQKAARAVSVLIMNGTNDPMMPWNGGNVRVLGKEYGAVLSTEKTVHYWVVAAQLPLQPETRYLDDISHSDQCTVEVDRYSTGGRQEEVVIYRIKGGGHNLPGGNTPDRPRLRGLKCMDINGSEVIWSFFKKHSRAQQVPPADAGKPRR